MRHGSRGGTPYQGQLIVALALVLLTGIALPARALPITQPPSLPVIEYPTYSSWYAHVNLTLTARYSAMSGAQQLNWTWSWDDGAFTSTTGTAANGTSTATHAWAAVGNYTVQVLVSDGWNPPVASLPIYVNVTLDPIPPVTTMTPSGLRGSGLWYIGPVTVSLAATDTGSGVASTTYRIDGGAWQTYSASFLLQTQGNHTVGYRSVDNAGNVEATHTATLSIDSLAPDISLQTPSNGSVITANSVTLTWAASDSGSGLAAVQYSINNAAFTSVAGSSVTFQGLADGTYTVLLRATDVAGNVATTSVTFTVHTAALMNSALLVGGIAAIAIIAVAAVAVLLWTRRRKGMPPTAPPPGPPLT